MAIYHKDIADIDLNSGTIHRSFANHSIGEGDVAGNQFGIRLFRNGVPVNIDGATCMGYFIRQNNEDTVIINGGTFSGNEAYVTLPESCYVYEGSFTLVIKLIGSGVAGTMRIVDGTIINSMIGTPIDPGSEIPDLASLMAVISRAETAAGVIAGFSVSAQLISGENYAIVVSTS